MDMSIAIHIYMNVYAWLKVRSQFVHVFLFLSVGVFLSVCMSCLLPYSHVFLLVYLLASFLPGIPAYLHVRYTSPNLIFLLSCRCSQLEPRSVSPGRFHSNSSAVSNLGNMWCSRKTHPLQVRKRNDTEYDKISRT